MSKVTSKYQVTVPKKIADAYSIHPGDEIDWVAAGDVIRILPPGKRLAAPDRKLQLRLFDMATERHRKRAQAPQRTEDADRGWRREDLYARGRAD